MPIAPSTLMVAANDLDWGWRLKNVLYSADSTEPMTETNTPTALSPDGPTYRGGETIVFEPLNLSRSRSNQSAVSRTTVVPTQTHPKQPRSHAATQQQAATQPQQE